ncbi:MAG: DUF5813 family protein [Halobacterium sp.]
MSDTESEFVDHPRFERVADRREATGGRAGSDGTRERVDDKRESTDVEFAPTTNDWEATVSVAGDELEIEVVVPTIQGATTEHVADVVADGWFDTFERRVRDADGVTRADDVEVTAVSREDGGVVVELSVEARAGNAAEDALALVNFVEGTWFQGVIPGYEYVEKVRELRERAAQNAQSADGTPL